MNEDELFESGLRDYLEAKPRKTMIDKRMLAVLDLPAKNRRRQRVLAHTKASATAQLRADGKLGAIDWGKIDWEKLFASIMKLIEMIMKLFA